MEKKTQHMHQASQLMRSQHSGVLSTVSLSLKGFPFGSVTPFLMTEAGDVVIYASDIAQHSRNMKANDKVSLCVYDASQQDSQASSRVTIIANASSDAVNDNLQAQYLSLFPKAKAYVKAHDFRFYLLKTHKVRYIGGFGEIYWFSNSEWNELMEPLTDSAQGAIEHMHDGHSDALAQIVSSHIKAAIPQGSVKMVTCFQHGFHYQFVDPVTNIETGETSAFIPFQSSISPNYDLRRAMVDLTKAARQTTNTNDFVVSEQAVNAV